MNFEFFSPDNNNYIIIILYYLLKALRCVKYMWILLSLNWWIFLFNGFLFRETERVVDRDEGNFKKLFFFFHLKNDFTLKQTWLRFDLLGEFFSPDLYNSFFLVFPRLLSSFSPPYSFWEPFGTVWDLKTHQFQRKKKIPSHLELKREERRREGGGRVKYIGTERNGTEVYLVVIPSHVAE